MPTHEEHAVIVEISDWLLDLYVKRDEACLETNWQRALLLQKEIEVVSEERRKVIESTE
jgi:hypothetical protein